MISPRSPSNSTQPVQVKGLSQRSWKHSPSSEPTQYRKVGLRTAGLLVMQQEYWALEIICSYQFTYSMNILDNYIWYVYISYALYTLFVNIRNHLFVIWIPHADSVNLVAHAATCRELPCIFQDSVMFVLLFYISCGYSLRTDNIKWI